MFSIRLEQLRNEKDLTQQQMAKILGITRQAYGNYENGKREPDFKTVNLLANYFNVSVDYLLGRTDEPTPYVTGTALKGSLRNYFKDKLSKEKSFDLVDALQDSNSKINATGQPLTQDQRVGILRALDNPNAFKKNFVPILGKVPAGIPVMANNEWDGELDIPSDIEADFALQVKGDSMIGAGIHEGDYAICREAYGASSGDIVVALEDVGPEYSRGTLKYYLENGQGVLRAANPDYEDIPLGDNHRITGIMIGLIRKGPTPLGYFRDYISIRDYHLKEWNAVIEEAVAGGIEPGFVKTLIQNQITLASQLAKRKSP